MRLKPRTWVLLALLCLLGIAVFWRSHVGRTLRNDAFRPEKPGAQTAANGRGAVKPKPLLLEQAGLPAPGGPSAGQANAYTNALLRYRLSNTQKSIGELTRSDSAILLRNALIDTAVGTDLPIPAHLRAKEDSGNYIVQSRGKLTDQFREQLRQAGAQIVSYVPNNAYLVQVSPAGANQLRALAETQSLLPWEPYYKLAPKFLALAVEEPEAGQVGYLNLAIFAGQEQAALGALENLNVPVLVRDRSPFGPLLTVETRGTGLAALAQLPMVQAIEPYSHRAPANDLGRARVRVATNTITATKYRGLDGSGITVNVNDTGVDGTHPDLSPRVTADRPGTLVDGEGHGTHVAGTIASSGVNGPAGINVVGSANGANFRGMAPAAKIYALPIDPVFGGVTDTYLQENAARTNALISNNSWSYPNDTDYTFAAASWDAAVRDALPGSTGPQPLMAVFAAGNSGTGNSAGDGGAPDTITSPATAKNVLSVGAIENFRRISNSVVINGQTNRPFLGATDSSNQVANFSSRGNVGIGVEGTYGRFKPDVVAPGAWVVSTRPQGWVRPTIETSYEVNLITNITLGIRQTNLGSIFIPNNGVELRLNVLTNLSSPNPFPGILIQAKQGSAPTDTSPSGINQLTVPVTGGAWFYKLINPNSQRVTFNFRTVIVKTNSSPTITEMVNLDASLNAPYGYESGTSMAAPVASGMLALMQQGFSQDLSNTNPSPALLKALLINGARSVNSKYDFQVNNTANYQGWGLINITNSYPESLQSGSSRTSSGLLYWDQSGSDQSTNKVLATGQSFTRTISIASAAARRVPLRVTLAWTDPPGNPSVATKLVNDLDLVVTNLDSGEVYSGNNFADGSVFTTGILTNGTNSVLVSDNVNNVENVFVQSTFSKNLGTNYSITVVARRVDVNAVTTVPEGIVQDFALVVASDNPMLPSAVTLGTETLADNPLAKMVTVTNGVPLLHQRVGANSPYLTSTNGNTNQWRFFVFGNTNNPANTNVVPGRFMAFHTFLAPNASRPRSIGEGDLDMYVSKNPAITNLDPAVLQVADRGLKRAGTETVILTNGVVGDTYYIGIKSEDQQAVEFGFFAVSSDQPFSTRDKEGNIISTAFPLFVDIPDGSPQDPQAALLFAFVMEPVTVDNVIVTNIMTHDSGGDLLGNLSHDADFVVLNNHNGFNGTEMFVYDDSDSGEILISEPTFGPGSLRDFIGKPGEGAWQLTMIDNSQFHTGRVDRFSFKIRPQPDNLGGAGVLRRIQPQRWTFTSTNVPPDATKLEVCVAPDNGPVEVYIRREGVPDRSTYDTFALIGPPGDCVSITRFDSPPLSQGRYIIGVYNPNTIVVDARIRVRVERDLGNGLQWRYDANGSTVLLDDATTNASIFINRSQLIADLAVGVRIEHPRISDLSLHLVSPTGGRTLLYENRGGPLATSLGFSTAFVTNVLPVVSAGSANTQSNIFDLPEPFGTLIVDYNFYPIPDFMHVYYDGSLIFDSGLVSGSGRFSVGFGPGFSTNLVIVMNEGENPNTGTAWDYVASVITGGHTYVNFTENTNLAQLPIKFAPPPYTTNFNATNPFAIFPQSDFEGAAPGDHGVGPLDADWTVVSNAVRIINDPPMAFSNSQFVAMADGIISRTLTTTAGAEYRLRYSYRSQCIAALWEGEQTSLDPIGLNNLLFSQSIAFTQGISGLAFSFNGTNADATAAASSSLDIGSGTNLTIECWINTTNIGRAQTLLEWAGNGVSLSLLAGGGIHANLRDIAGNDHVIPGPGVINTPGFHHLALTYDLAKDEAALYVDGTKVGAILAVGAFRPNTTNDFLIGYSSGAASNVRFEGLMDDIGLYTCALSDAEILAIYKAGLRNQGKCDSFSCNPAAEIAIDGMTNSVRSASNWNFGIFEFIAASNSTSLSLIGGVSSVLFDSFELLQKQSDPALYFLPEEPLSQFRGQNAYGEWRLEAWDTRTGGALTNGEIISWKLNINFVNTNLPATILTNGQCISGLLATNQAAYFIVDVPIFAGHATNHLTSGTDPLSLRYSQFGLPAGQFYRSSSQIISNVDAVAVVGRNGTATYDPAGALLATNGLPRLQPGRRYYLAVENLGTNTQPYTLCIGFDRFDDVIFNTPEVLSGIHYTNTIPVTNRLDYYHFNAASNAVQLEFDILRYPNGNVNLYVLKGDADDLPNTSRFDPPPGVEPGTNSERIVYDILNRPLLGGNWNIGVANFDTTPVTYVLRVTQTLAITPTTMTNQIPQTNTICVTNVDYYTYEISNTTYRADFEVLNPTLANVDLYISRDRFPPPSQQNKLYASENPGTANEFIAVYTNDVPARVPDEWVMGVTNTSTNCVTYSVRVTEYPMPPIIPLSSGVTVSNTVSSVTISNMDLYSFVVSPTAVQANFEIFNLSGDANLYAARSPINALRQTNGTSNFQPGTNPEVILLTTNGPPLLAPGIWYLAVTNADPGALPVSYSIRATEILTANVVRLTNGAGFSNNVASASITNRGIDYYRFTVSSNAYQAMFETYSASGNVDLYARKGLPLPTDLEQLSSTNLGQTNEIIVVRTNALPVPLTSGDWYLAVYNRDPGPGPVSYIVRATELLPPPILRLSNGISVTNVVLAPNGTTNLGVNYYVFNVSPTAIEAHFETFSTNGNVDLYVRRGLPLPSDTTFDAASTNSYPANEFIAITTNGTPPLLPGDWYLAVYTRETTNVTFTVRATEFFATNIVTLTNASPYATTTVASNGTPAGGISYFRFVVTNTAVQANFEILNPSGNVDLYIRRDLPLASPANATFSSANSGTLNEFIAVATNLTLLPGDWYIAVVNRTAAPVSYAVRATQFAEGLPTLIRLQNGIAYTSNVNTNELWFDLRTHYYVFSVTNTAQWATFEINRPTNTVELVLRKGVPLPTATLRDYQSGLNSGANTNDVILVTTNSTVPLSPGEWYLGVYQSNPAAVGTFNYSVRATQFTSPIPPVLTNCLDYVAGRVPANATDYYVFPMPTNTIQANFEILNPNGDVDLYVRRGLPVPSPTSFFYASTNLATASELIVVTNGAPIPPSPGDWYLAVVNKQQSAVNYTVRVSAFVQGSTNLIVLSNGIGFLKNGLSCPVAAGAIDYYQFPVTPAGARAQFEVLSPSEDVNLIVRKGLPLPTIANSPYASSNTGTADELITLFSPQLAAGDWYLGVVRTSANPVSYTVKATEFTTPGTNVVITAITVNTNTAQVCLTWAPTLTGVHYYVQAKTNLTDAAWTIVSPRITATGTPTSFCVPLTPATNQFYRISQ